MLKSLLVILAAWPAFASDTAPVTNWTPTEVAPRTFVLDSQNKTVVTIHPDGTVELGKDVTLDEASKAFWDVLQREGMKLACPKAQ